MGVGISEFPINLESARAARERGMSTVFGAPNILRGKSQSGAIRALDAVKAGAGRLPVRRLSSGDTDRGGLLLA